jgi:hypothetical protein
VLNSLGELSSRRAAGQQARDYHNQALTLARQVGAPLEEARALTESATATSVTATPAKEPPTCGMHSPSTSALAPQPPGASRTPCACMGSSQPATDPPAVGICERRTILSRLGPGLASHEMWPP